MEGKPLKDLFSFDISPYAQWQVYPSGGVIFPPWEELTQLVYLVEGRAKCTTSLENGAVTILDFAQGPCFLGEMELLGVQEMSSEVTAQTECRGWVIQWEHCREKMLADPVFLRALCVASNEKAVRVTAAAVRNQNYPLKNRLATFLLNTQHQGVYREPHAQAAAYLGGELPPPLVGAGGLSAGRAGGKNTGRVPLARLGRPAGPANSGCVVALKRR